MQTPLNTQPVLPSPMLNEGWFKTQIDEISNRSLMYNITQVWAKSFEVSFPYSLEIIREYRTIRDAEPEVSLLSE